MRRVPVMTPRVPLVTALLLCCAGESSVHGPPEPVLALAGGDVTLPCSFSIKANEDFPTVEWSKEGLQPNVVFLYRDGCETPEMKNPAFQYRTSLITKELMNGNISLRISNVQLSDAGRYQCMRRRGAHTPDITAVELVVGAVSQPILFVSSAEGGALTLHCEADCWLPEPDVVFLDEQGNDIAGDEPKRDQDARGCYSVRRRTTLRDASQRVTCRVHQVDINQTRDVEILLPVVEKMSCILVAAIAVGIVLLLQAVACVLAVFLWKRFGKSAGEPNSPSPSYRRTPSGSEDLALLESGLVPGAENTKNTAIEMLTKEVEDLKLKPREKEDVQLQVDQVAAHLAAASTKSSSLTPGKRPGISRQSSHPAQGASRPVDRPDRRHSTPALLDPVWPPGSCIGPSTSDPRAFGPGPNAKLQRPHSSGFPSLPTSSNPFTLLANVTEDAEMLIP